MRAAFMSIALSAAAMVAHPGFALGAGTGRGEVFADVDRPSFGYESSLGYYWCEPWNYSKAENASREYPLVVYLHGSSGAGNISYLWYLGYGEADLRARAFQTAHPCFVLVPQTSGSWDDKALIALIEGFRKGHRIDPSRLYLIGYSMGGSESFSLANAYYDHDKTLFAGIIRLAGQSQPSVRDAIAAKSAIWLHIGLDDDLARVKIAREAYAFLKKHNPDAVEYSNPAEPPGARGTTLTLRTNGVGLDKKTEYTGVGHDIASLPFEDPAVIDWLFAHRSR
jgi:predicted peptidase